MKELAIFGIVMIVLIYTGLQHIFNWGYRYVFKGERDEEDSRIFAIIILINSITTVIAIMGILSLIKF